MKRSVLFLLLAILLSAVAFSQTSAAPDAFKSSVEKLQSLTHQDEPAWRLHSDIPHPEDPALSDSDWGTLTVKNISEGGGGHADEEDWTGTRVFRGWIQIPEKINGYATHGSEVRLDLRFGSPGSLMITVFSNGAVLYRGSDDDILPVLLTENAQPGQKFLVAARVVAGDGAQA
jgi:hypothetical protein